jgi:hypothetical protein
MTKTFVGAKASLRPTARGRFADGRSQTNPNTESQPRTTTFERMKEEMAYWALRAYIRVLMMIGWASELTANYKRKEER